MLQAKNLTKSFYLKEKESFFKRRTIEKKAVVDVSLELKKGSIIGLLGVNGAGKTTTIKMLSSLLEPTSGSFTINDIDGVKKPHEIRKIINVITGGERNIYWRLTAIENLEYFGALYNIPKKILKTRIAEVIDLVGLKEAEKMPVEKYSKGMKQRLQFARGLINDPQYLFLDEPTLGLDIGIARELRLHTKNLARQHGKGVLLTTHYIAEAEELCDYIYIIHEGAIISQGTPSDLKKSAVVESKEVRFHASALNEQDKIMIKKIVDPHTGTVVFSDDSFTVKGVEDCSMAVVHYLSQNNIQLNQLERIEPDLEETLFQLTQENHAPN